MDNKELTAGSTLFLPVWNEGANFSVGHGRQGDGEVCVNALKMGLTGVFGFPPPQGWRSESALAAGRDPDPLIAMGFHEDLDVAMKTALRRMIAFIGERSWLTAVQAYQFCSLAVDFRITQTVNGEKGVHAMLEKGVLF